MKTLILHTIIALLTLHIILGLSGVGAHQLIEHSQQLQEQLQDIINLFTTDTTDTK